MSTNRRNLVLAELIRQKNLDELARTTNWEEILSLANQSAEFRDVLDNVDGPILFEALGDLSEELPEEVERAISPSETYAEELAHLVRGVLVPKLHGVPGLELIHDRPIEFVTAINAISATLSSQLGPKTTFGTSVCWQLNGDVTRLTDKLRSHVQMRPEVVISHGALATEVAFCLELDEVTRDVQTFVACTFEGCIRMPRLLPDFLRTGALRSEHVELQLLAPERRISATAERWARTDDRESEEAVDACVGVDS
jgi:hypothetical protein